MSISKILKDKFLNQEHRAREPNELYVTDLVICALKYTYQIDPESPAILHGNAIHYAFERVLLENGYRVEVPIQTEVVSPRSKKKWKISGRVDALSPSFKPVEIKSSSVISTEHLTQLYIYMLMLGVSSGYLVYSSSSRFFVYSFDGEVLSDEDGNDVIDVREKFNVTFYPKMLEELVAKFEEGSNIAHLNQCSSCFYRNICIH